MYDAYIATTIKDNTIREPINCTDRGKKAVETVLNLVKIAEPVSVITIAANGITQPYLDACTQLKAMRGSRSLYCVHCTNDDDINSIDQQLDFSKPPFVLVVNLSTQKDESKLLKHLDDLRREHEGRFVPVVFSNIIEVFSALNGGNKTINLHTHVLLPVPYEELYDWKIVTEDERKSLYKDTGGHLGLTKTLFILGRERGVYNYIHEELLKTPSVIARLEEIWRDIPQEKQRMWLTTDICSSEDPFWETYGFVTRGEYTIPLLAQYVDIMRGRVFGTSSSPIRSEMKQILTENEIEIYSLLKRSLGEIVPRGVIAEILWGDDVLEKYSDWAIDQSIHRLRKKLEGLESVYEVVTKKGRGFILTRDS